MPDKVEKENPQGIAEPNRVTSLEECGQENANTEEVFQTESEGTYAKEQTLTEQLSTEKGTTVPPKRKNKINKLEKLQREWKRLQKLVK